MASSPPTEPPGFETLAFALPPPLECPPSQIDSVNCASPDAGPPGFEKPNAWMLEATPIGNRDGIYNQHVTASTGEDVLPQPMLGAHVGELSHPYLPESEVAVPIDCPTIDPFQPGSGCSGIETLDAPLAKVEVRDPTMLVPSQPPSLHPETSDNTLIGDGLGEAHGVSKAFYHPEAESEKQDLRPVPKLETASLGNESSFECVTVPVSQLTPELVSESLSLPPSPPPLPMVFESVVSESGYESLDPLPVQLPLPPPALTVCDMPKSIVLESKYDNTNQSFCNEGPSGDEIPSEHGIGAPTQPPLSPQKLGILDPAMLPPPPPPPPLPPSPPPQFKPELVPEMDFDNLNVLQPVKEGTRIPSNQEMEMFSCPQRDGIPDTPLFETGTPVNEIINEPLLKKSRIMHETHDQLTHKVCQPEVEKDLLVSETPDLSTHEEEDMEALQIDMDLSEDETLYRSPTYTGPPGSDTKDSESMDEGPPGYDTIDSNSQMEMMSQDALSGGSCTHFISSSSFFFDLHQWLIDISIQINIALPKQN